MPKIIEVPGMGRVEFPDSMDDRMIEAAIQRNIGNKSVDVEAAGEAARTQYFKDQPRWQNALTGAGKAVVDFGRGAGQALGLVPDSDIAASRAKDQAILDAPGGTAGNIAGNIAAAVPAAFVPGANTLAGAAVTGAVMGALQPTVQGENRALNAAIGGGLGAAGQKAGGFLAGKLSDKLAAREAAATAKQLQDAPMLATAKAAQEAGYTLPPTQLNPSRMNNMLEGLAGRISTQQVASERNQAVTNSLVKKALSLPDDQPITIDALKQVRAQAGQAYEAVKATGTVQADPLFNAQLDHIMARYQGASKDFPGLANEKVAGMVEALRQPQFGADSAIDAISVLRDSADDAFRKGDAQIGKAAKTAAAALEDQIGRHVAALGDPDLLKAYQEARKAIAKTYSVQAALNESTGNVITAKLAKQLEKGKPLSGELKQVAEIGRTFPKATQEISRSMPGVSPLDWIASTGTSMASGSMLPLSWLVGRPAARAAVLSPAYQARMTTPGYAAPASLRLSDLLFRNGRGALAGQFVAPSVYAAQE